MLHSRTGYRRQYGTCELHAVYLSLRTNSEYVILTFFALQKCLHERVSLFVIRKLFALLFIYYSQLIRFINTRAELITTPRRSGGGG
jgi:hypothetical protein